MTPQAHSHPWSRGRPAGDMKSAEPAEKTRWLELLGADSIHAQSVIAAVGKQANIVQEVIDLPSPGQPQKAMAWLAFISIGVLGLPADTCSDDLITRNAGFRCMQRRCGDAQPTSVG